MMGQRIFQLERKPFTISDQTEHLTLETSEDGIEVWIKDHQANESTYTIPYDQLLLLIAVLQTVSASRK